MITSNTESELQRSTQLLNQPNKEKQGCSQPSESKRQVQEFAAILGTLKQQQRG